MPDVGGVPQAPTIANLAWLLVPLDPSEEEELRQLEAKPMGSAATKLRTAEKRSEVRLHARKRGELAGEEDNLGAQLDELAGETGAQRWHAYLCRSRTKDS